MGLFPSECANCGSKEHATNECPHGIFSSKCSNCGSVDHSTSQCPHGIFSEKCSICGSTEHSTDDCPHGILSSECGICGSVDHSTKNCPHGILSTECSNCGSKNHSTSDCPHGIFNSRSSSDRRVNYSSQTSGENAISGCLGKMIAYLILAVVIIWLVFAVAIPFIIINIAIISLVVGLVQKKYKIYLFTISILAMGYLIIDYNKGYFTKTLVNNVPFLDGVIPIFFYLNIIAGLIATYFIIRDLYNKKSPPIDNEGEFSKRNLIIMICLLFFSIFIIVFQKRYGVENIHLVQSTVIESPTAITQPNQITENIIKNKVNEYLQRNMQSSVEYVSSLYAENVDFYNAGIVDKNYIINDKRNYFIKWPERNMTLTSSIDVMNGNRERTWLANFNFHYQVKSARRNQQGDAWCKLIFRQESNSIIIISEKGGILSNKPEKVNSTDYSGDNPNLVSNTIHSISYKIIGDKILFILRSKRDDVPEILVDVNQNSIIDRNYDRSYGYNSNIGICSQYRIDINSSTVCGGAPSNATLAKSNYDYTFTIPLSELESSANSTSISVSFSFWNSLNGFTRYPENGYNFSKMFSIKTK